MRDILKKLTYSSLKDIYKKSGGKSNVPRTKTELINLICRELSEDQLSGYLISGESYKNTNIELRNLHLYKIEIFIAVLAIIVTISLTFLDDIKRITIPCKDCFSGDAKYNLMILPYNSVESCQAQNNFIEYAIEKWFINSVSIFGKDVEVKIYNDELNAYRVSVDRASEIGREKGAHIVVWGDYKTKCNWDSIAIRTNYINLTSHYGTMSKELPKVYESVESLLAVENGSTVNGLKNTVLQLIGFQYFFSADYESAIKILKQVDNSTPYYSMTNSFIATSYCRLYNSDAAMLDSSLYYVNREMNNDSLLLWKYLAYDEIYRAKKDCRSASDSSLEALNYAKEIEMAEKEFWIRSIISNLIKSAYKCDKLDLAIKELQILIKEHPNEKIYYYLLLFVNRKNNDLNGLADLLQLSTDKFPHDTVLAKIWRDLYDNQFIFLDQDFYDYIELNANFNFSKE